MENEEYLGLEPMEEEETGANEEHLSPAPTEEETYSSKVQKRIDKLTWEKKVAIEERNAAMAKSHDLEEKWRAIEVAKSNEGAQAEIDGLKSKIAQAFEDGDHPTMIDLQDQLQVKRAEMLQSPKKREPEARQQVAEAQPEVNPHAMDWLERNPWYNEKPRAASVAREMEADLVEQGFEYGEDLYQELDRKLEAAGYRDKPDAPRRSQVRSPVSGSSRGNEGREQAPSGKLKDVDLAIMRKYGFNPSSPSDRKAWLDRNSAL